jgi:hypothetical protein
MNAKKIKQIKRLIHANLVGEEIGIGNSDASIILKEIEKDEVDAIVAIGGLHDADAVVFFKNIGINVIILLFIGRIFCSGEEIKDYLFEYHDRNSEETEKCIKWLVNTAFEGLKTESAALAILRCDNSESWRGFRGNEIEAKKTNSLH